MCFFYCSLQCRQVALTVLAVKKYRAGVADNFQSGYDPNLFGEGVPPSSAHGQYSPPDAQGSLPYQAPGDYGQSPFTDPTAQPAAAKAAQGGGYQQSY